MKKMDLRMIAMLLVAIITVNTVLADSGMVVNAADSTEEAVMQDASDGNESDASIFVDENEESPLHWQYIDPDDDNWQLEDLDLSDSEEDLEEAEEVPDSDYGLIVDESLSDQEDASDEDALASEDMEEVTDEVATEEVEEDSISDEAETLEQEEVEEDDFKLAVENNIHLRSTGNEESKICFAWTILDVTDVSYFEVYRDDLKIATVAATEEQEYFYKDKNRTEDETYEYKVVAYNSDKEKLCESNELSLFLCDDWRFTNSETVTLTEDKTVNNLIFYSCSPTIILNGHTLTVLGDIKCLNGTSYARFVFNKGSLICNSVRTNNMFYLIMTNEEDYFLVNDDFEYGSNTCGSPSMVAGTLEIKGDIIANRSTDYYGYQQLNEFNTILSGNQKQHIKDLRCYAYDYYFNNLEIRNYSKDGVLFDYPPCAGNSFVTNGCKVSLGLENECLGMVLEEDTTIIGDLLLGMGELDLNGHTLTVTGDLNQMSGTLNINKGKLYVKGDYNNCFEDDLNTSNPRKSYTTSDGLLVMVNPEDYMRVEGNVFIHSRSNERGKMSAGTLEVWGDFENYCYSDKCYNNLFMTDDFLLKLNGTSEQKLYIYTTACQAANIDFANENITGSSYFAYTGKLTGYVPESVKKYSTRVFLDAKEITETTYTNNISIQDNFTSKNEMIFKQGLTVTGDLVLGADMTVSGQLNINGKLDLNGHTLSVGYINFYSKGYMIQDQEDSVLIVKNNFDYHEYSSSSVNSGDKSVFSAGTLIVGGAFECRYSDFKAIGTHKLVLNGSKPQSVYVSSRNVEFNIVEILNTSEDGITFSVYSEGKLTINSLINESNVPVTGYSEKQSVVGDRIEGYVLEEDTEIEGNLILSSGTLDLNGHTLTVKGDFYHEDGTLNINTGALYIEGNYSSSVSVNSKATISMTHIEDIFSVSGNMTVGSFVDETKLLTKGNIYLYGDVIQKNISNTYSSSFYNNFSTTGNIIVHLCGTEKQTIIPCEKNSTVFGWANLYIENTSEEGIVFNSGVGVKTYLKDNQCKKTGKIIFLDDVKLNDGFYQGDVSVRYSSSVYNKWDIDGNVDVVSGTYFYNDLKVNGNLNISSSTYFGKNATIKGDLNNTSSLEINRCSISVSGNVLSKSSISLSGATLTVYGNYKVENWGHIYLYKNSNTEAVLNVYGNFQMEKSSYIYGTDGTVNIKGNVLFADTAKLYEGSTVVLKLSGNQKQTMTVSSPSVVFHKIVIENTSEEGVDAPYGINAITIVNSTGCPVSNNLVRLSAGTLSGDTVFDGDQIFSAGTLNLNGYTLTIKGNLTHHSGTINLNGGKLIVEGDYIMKTDGYDNYAVVTMNKASDYILVEGDFSYYSRSSNNWSLGTLELKKNFICSSSYLHLSNNQTVIFSGSEKQDAYKEKYAQPFYNLIIENENGVNFGPSVHVQGQLDTKGKKLDSELYFYNGASVSGNIYDGNVRFDYSSLTVDKPLHITGDAIFNLNNYYSYTTTIDAEVIIDGNITGKNSIAVRNGSLTVLGDVDLTNSINLTANPAKVLVGGNLKVNSFNITADDAVMEVDGNCIFSNMNTIRNGLLILKGDLKYTGASSYNSNYNWEGMKLTLSGNGLQVVEMPSDFKFGVVELQNPKREGVYISCLQSGIKELIDNGVKIHWWRQGQEGWTLEENTIIDSDLEILGGVLDLNGYSLTVNGDLYMEAGTLNINGGSLTVAGDLRFQMVELDEDGDVDKTSDSLSYFKMTNDDDYVLVKGDFYMQSLYSNSGNLQRGTLELKGDLRIINSDYYNFQIYSGYGHTVLFSGNKRQRIIYDEYIKGYYSTTSSYYFDRLVIENTSEAGVICDHNIYIYSELNDVNNKLTATKGIYISKLNGIVADEVNADINTYNVELNHNLTVNGNLTINNSGTLNGLDLNVKKNLFLSAPLYLGGGSVRVDGNVSLANTGGFTMTQDSDYVQIKGDLLINTNKDKTTTMNAGTLEVGGTLSQNSAVQKAFVATGTHKTILTGKTGDALQYITLKEASNKFNKLVLWRDVEYYSFSPELEKICAEYEIDYKDETAPSKATGLKAQEVLASSAVISWNAATDNVKVTGYEIYRNGKKVGVSSELSYRDKGLVPNTTYEYYVIAYDQQRNLSQASNTIEIKTTYDVTAPVIPSGFKMTSKTGSAVNLSWVATTDDVAVKGYKIYRDDKLVATLAKDVLTYKDVVPEKEVLYSYTVTAFDTAGNESEASSVVKASAMDPVITGISPANNKTIGGGKQYITVNFKNLGGTVNRVKFEYRDMSEEEIVWVQVGNLYYQSTNSSTGAIYSQFQWDYSRVTPGNCPIRITVYDADNNATVEELNYYIDNEGPEAVTNLKALCLDGVVELTWTPSASDDVYYYQILRAKEGGTPSVISTYQTKCTYRDANVVLGDSYDYYVKGVDIYNQQGPLSASANVLITADEESPKVTDITCDGHTLGMSQSVRIFATDNRTVAKIGFYYRGEGQEEWILIDEKEADSKGEALFTFDTSELAEGPYEIKAEATDVAGNVSEPYMGTVAIDHTGISKIEVTEAISHSNYVTLRWKDVPDEDLSHFVIEQKKAGVFVKVAEENKTLGYNVTDLAPNTEYTFRVVGYDFVGNRGIESDEIIVSTVEDTDAPIVTDFGPRTLSHTSSMLLAVNTKDNVGVDKAILSYSYDKENWTKIVELQANLSKTYLFTYSFDVSTLPEGKIYIKASVFDAAGNESNYEGEPIINEFEVDHTGPVSVNGLTATGNEGHITISWNEVTNDDIKGFNIYRCEDDTEYFKLYASNYNAYFYHDAKVEVGKTYQYKVQAIDAAGNLGALSEAVAASATADSVPPSIGFSLRNDQTLTGKVEVNVVAYDESMVKSILVEYKEANAVEDLWTEIYSKDLAEMSTVQKFTWDVSNLRNTKYQVRVIATDSNNNVSDPFIVVVNIDTKAPEKPSLTANATGYGAELSWTASSADDFAFYRIYRRLSSEADFTLIDTTTKETYIDKDLQIKSYVYKVAAVDTTGNSAHSNEVAILPLEEDTVAPVAKCSDTYTTAEERKLKLDASDSTDNVAIVKYTWDMGNGDTVNGAIATYSYMVQGTYEGILTVEDKAGNKNTKAFTVKVLDKNSGIADITVTTEKDGVTYAVPYASISVEDPLGTVTNFKADGEGKLELILPGGRYKVAAFKDGYLPKTYNILITNGEEKEEALKIEEGKLVTGEITTKRLTLEEAEELGVDLQDPANWYKETYKITYWENIYTSRTIYIPIPSTPGTYYYSESTVNGGGSGGGGASGGSGSGYYLTVHDVCGKRLVTIYRYVEYLKKMYSVNLTVTNNAEDGFGFDIIGSKAKLNLPTGLSLLSTSEKQNLTKDFGTLKAQQTKETCWYIKADKPGSYRLSATFTGTLLPFEEPVNTVISASKPLVVSDKEDNTFDDEGFITGEPENYYIYVNNSSNSGIKGAKVYLYDEDGKKSMTITNRDGRAILHVNKDDDRTFTLYIEKDVDGYRRFYNPEYTLQPKRTSISLTGSKAINDVITLYGEDEEIPADGNGSWAEFKVTYYTAGGKLPDDHPGYQKYFNGQTFDKMPIPTWYNDSKKFMGWFDSNDNQYKDGLTVNLENDLRLTARYASSDSKLYTVTFNAMGADLEFDTRTVEEGKIIGKLPDVEKEGYLFAGWYYGTDKVTADTKYNYGEDITLEAEFYDSKLTEPCDVNVKLTARYNKDTHDLVHSSYVADYRQKESFQIDITIPEGYEHVKYQLVYADKSVIKENETGQFSNLVATYFLSYQDVYAYVTYQVATPSNRLIDAYVMQKINLVITDEAVVDEINNWKLRIGGPGLGGFTIPDNIPIVGGKELSLGFDALPVSATIEEGKLVVGINMPKAALTKKFDSSGNEIKDPPKTDEKKKFSISDSYDKWKADLISNAQRGKKVFTDFNYLDPDALYADMPLVSKGSSMQAIGYLEADWTGSIDHIDSLSGKLTLVLIPIEYERTINSAIPVVEIPVTLVLKYKMDVIPEGTLGYDFNKAEWYGSIDVNGSVTFRPYAGIGVGTLASIGVYGEATGNYEIEALSSDHMPEGFKRAYLKGGIGLAAYFAGCELGSLELLNMGDLRKINAVAPYVTDDNKLMLFSRHETALFPKSSRAGDDAAGMEVIDLSDYYQDTDNIYRNAQFIEATESKFVGGNNGVVASDVYFGSSPKLVAVGDEIYLFYLDTNTKRSAAANQCSLYYARYNSKTGAFENPEVVNDDGTSDYLFDVVADESSAYVVYMDSSKKYKDDEAVDVAEYVGSFGISIAKVDAEAVTDLEYFHKSNYCFMPRAIVTSEGLQIAWVENSKNNVFGADGKNTIKTALCQDGVFGKETVIASDLNAVTSLGFAADGDTLSVVYAMDTDNDLYETMEQKLVSVKTDGTVITSKVLNVASIKNAVYGGEMSLLANVDGALVLFDANLKQTNITESGVLGSADDFIVDGDRIYYLATGDSNRNVYATIKNGGTYRSVPITEESGYVDAFSVVDGQLVYQLTEADLSSYYDANSPSEIEKQCSIKYMTSTEKKALSIYNVYYSYKGITPGEEMQFDVYVDNDGTRAVQAYDMALYPKGDKSKAQKITVTTNIAPGDRVKDSIKFTLPTDLSADVYVLEITSTGAKAGANTFEVSLGRTELVADAETFVYSKNTVIKATASNISYIPTIATTTVYDEAGTEIFTKTEKIDAMADNVYEVDLGDVNVSDNEVKKYYVEVSTADAEYKLDNNVACTLVGQIHYEPAVFVAKATDLEAEEHTVTFNPKSGTLVSSDDDILVQNSGKTAIKIVKNGEKYGKLPTPVSGNEVFTGWYTDPVEGKRVRETQIVSLSADQVLYAHWSGDGSISENDAEVTVTFDANGGQLSYSASDNAVEVSSDKTSATKVVIAGEAYGTLPTASNDKYDFAGWYTEKNGGTKVDATTIVSISENHTIYARWSNKKYKVTFDAAGGKADKDSITVENSKKYGELPKAEKKGYVFAGWFTASENGVKVTSDSEVNLSADQKLFAHWDYINLAVKQKYNAAMFYEGIEEVAGYQVIEGKGIAVVSKKGLVTAKKAGEVVIAPYKLVNKKKVVMTEVEPLHLVVTKPAISGKLVITNPKQIGDLNEFLINVPGNSNTVTWTVKAVKKPYVTLDEKNSNLIAPVRNGKVKVTAEIVNDQNYATKISMTVTVKMPKPSATNVSVAVGKAKKLKFTSLTGQTISWVSKNPEIATVNEATGEVQGVGVGPAVIVATIDGNLYEFNVNVKEK